MIFSPPTPRRSSDDSVIWEEWFLSKHSDFPRSPVGKESAFSEGDPHSIPRLKRSPGEGNRHPLQYSCLENPMDRGAWWATVYGVARVGQDLMTKPTAPNTLRTAVSLVQGPLPRLPKCLCCFPGPRQLCNALATSSGLSPRVIIHRLWCFFFVNMVLLKHSLAVGISTIIPQCLGRIGSRTL